MIAMALGRDIRLLSINSSDSSEILVENFSKLL